MRPPPPPKKAVRAKAMFEFEATEDWQVGLAEGEIVTVIEQNDDGWWEVAASGGQACVPGTYLEIIRVNSRGPQPPPPTPRNVPAPPSPTASYEEPDHGC